ncbi:hypothetical protein V4U86_20990 [Mycobacterium sp. AMU20-3851]|uniref:hypothetical protein n=1 Tax=Mycobacterium sp. AMU20-3851 TaxID=3122055 RepID=UPI0037550DAB
MFADTAAITVAGAELSRSATEFDGIAGDLPAALAPWVPALGPVGADFLAALASALDESAAQVARLGGDLAAAAGLAVRTAAAYADVEHRTDRSIAMLGG